MQWTRSVAPAESGSPFSHHAASNLSSPTHLMLWVPGTLGTIDPRGVPVVGREVGTVDAQREQRAVVHELGLDETRSMVRLDR